MKKKKHKKINEMTLAIKLIVIILHLIIITILFVFAYKSYKNDQIILPWSQVKDTADYSYLKISKMSESFATSSTKNITFHFVIEKETTGSWHTYIIAIKKEDYNKYKDLIDYTYERIEKEPAPLTIYGYPVLINKTLKNLAIKNLPNFLPKENEVIITKDNYEKYLTNSYLDTTKPKKQEFNMTLFIALTVLILMIISLLMTIFNIEIYRKRKHKKLLKRKNISIIIIGVVLCSF